MRKTYKHNYQIFIISCIFTIALTTACSYYAQPEVQTITPTTTPFMLQRFSFNRNFGDGYIANISTENFNVAQPEDSVKIMMTEWLEYYKAQTQNTDYKIVDYRIESLDLLDIPKDSKYQFVVSIRFAIIPVQIPNQWVSLQGDLIITDDNWWHFTEIFGVTKVNEIFNFFLLSAQV